MNIFTLSRLLLLLRLRYLISHLFRHSTLQADTRLNFITFKSTESTLFDDTSQSKRWFVTRYLVYILGHDGFWSHQTHTTDIPRLLYKQCRLQSGWAKYITDISFRAWCYISCVNINTCVSTVIMTQRYRLGVVDDNQQSLKGFIGFFSTCSNSFKVSGLCRSAVGQATVITTNDSLGVIDITITILPSKT